MNIRTKILIGFGTTLFLVVVVWVWAIYNLSQLGNASDAILRENYRSILAAENMIDTMERQDSANLLLLLGYRDEGLAQFQRNEIEFLQWLARAKDNITIEGEAAIVSAIEKGYGEFLAHFAHLRDLEIAGSDEALDYYHESVLPRFQQVRDRSIALRELNQETMVNASQRTEQLAVRAIWSTVGVGAVAILLGLAFSFWLSHILARPLRLMAAAADRIADGDYDVQLEVAANDELGYLAQRIMTMSYKLKTFHRLNVGQIMAEKRRNEAIIRSITDGVVVVDADLKIVAINPEAAHIFSVNPALCVGEHFFDAIENPHLYECVRETLKAERPRQLSDEDATFVVTNGEQTEYYHFDITPVKTGDGQRLGVVLLLQNITKLKELDRLKSEFVATASHELRTPLTSMAMSIGLLRESAAGKLTSREQELIAAADEDVKRLRTLVNDLLDLSKIESGRMEMDFSVVEADLLIQQAMQPFHEQAVQHGVELLASIPDNLPPVRADPTKITWVLTNLIVNALRYTDPGGQIQISADGMGSRVAFSVADTGIGIPLEYQSKIFDKFVQVAGQRAAGGSGLGLAISREIVSAHGGAIWVESTPGEGSTFTFTLPVAGGAPESVKDTVLSKEELQ
ncbi:MAG: PAS domain-containing protein [Caldilineaceae bacterium]|nr:PAS domain-containing protein [Caldilineaceae bacterium]